MSTVSTGNLRAEKAVKDEMILFWCLSFYFCLSLIILDLLSLKIQIGLDKKNLKMK